MDQMVDATVGPELLSFMDAYLGYNQIKMYSKDKDKTTFTTSRAINCYIVTLFGLKNTEATFKQTVNEVFKEIIGNKMDVYIDDMLVKSFDHTNHVKNLEEAFTLLRKFNVKLNLEKCTFRVASTKFLR